MVGEPVQPLPGEIALWGTLQSGVRKGERPEPSGWLLDREGTERLLGVIVGMAGLVGLITGLPDAETMQGLMTWENALSGMALLAGYAILFGTVKIGKRVVDAKPTRTAWFLSRERLVASSADGAGLAVAIDDIRHIARDFAEGSEAVTLGVLDGDITVLAADARGLYAALVELRPELAE